MVDVTATGVSSEQYEYVLKYHNSKGLTFETNMIRTEQQESSIISHEYQIRGVSHGFELSIISQIIYICRQNRWRSD